MIEIKEPYENIYVLIVEDDDLFRELIERHFEKNKITMASTHKVQSRSAIVAALDNID